MENQHLFEPKKHFERTLNQDVRFDMMTSIRIQCCTKSWNTNKNISKQIQKTGLHDSDMAGKQSVWTAQIFLFKSIVIKLKHLHLYLNCSLFLFRLKREQDKYPDTTRVVQHLLLSNTSFTRSQAFFIPRIVYPYYFYIT